MSERESNNRDANGFEQYKSPEASDVFLNRLKQLETRAEALGITMSYAAEINNIPVRDSHELLFGASLGKLPLAGMAIDCLKHDTVYDWKNTDLRDETGRGEFDRLASVSDATTAELVEDMLRNSGNTAYRVLARGLAGPEAINRYYEAKWANTRVEVNPDNGRAALGKTTPSEALAQLKSVLEGTSGDEQLRDRARWALENNNATNRGVRTFVVPHNDLTIYNKTGEYNGDVDDPYIFRHDVGVVQGPHKTVGFAIMTRSPLIARGSYRYIANSLVAQVGAEMAREAGGRDIIKLGSHALRFVL